MKALIIALLMAPAIALAQQASPETDADQPFAYEDPLTVQPRPLPAPDDDGLMTEEVLVLPPFHPGRTWPGQPPVAAPDEDELLDWLDNDLIDTDADSVEPLAAGANGWRYTNSRVFPKDILRSYPYTTIGKFTASGASCTGAVVARRLVLTAGHCVYDAVARQWYTDFRFYPGFYDGIPLSGPWFGRQAWTTNAWVNGGERLPNSGDFALVIFHDQAVGGFVRPIGEVTGWLGSTTNQFGEHITQFGYPGNLDSSSKPQRTDAQVAQINAIDYRYGTNQTEGSSGGPIIRDFGENGVGQNFPLNRVVGVVSFGLPGFIGTSKLSSNFTSLRRAACNAHPGNC